MALSAFILIEVAGDHTKSAFRTIQRISGVKATYTVSGRYDLVVQIERENLLTLSDLLLSQIRAVAGVTMSYICIVLNESTLPKVNKPPVERSSDDRSVFRH